MLTARSGAPHPGPVPVPWHRAARSLCAFLASLSLCCEARCAAWQPRVLTRSGALLPREVRRTGALQGTVVTKHQPARLHVPTKAVLLTDRTPGRGPKTIELSFGCFFETLSTVLVPAALSAPVSAVPTPAHRDASISPALLASRGQMTVTAGSQAQLLCQTPCLRGEQEKVPWTGTGLPESQRPVLLCADSLPTPLVSQFWAVRGRCSPVLPVKQAEVNLAPRNLSLLHSVPQLVLLYFVSAALGDCFSLHDPAVPSTDTY
ncbi:hypothetical protein H920_14150 [Fukomys damarensis]|uniref:Uncharacterized protein n=1 Tax=Fukomys damarensis TaxID=885580 RepID=A0A091CXC5_FUKDA|nr:hypothetical protein H920_14150 [Fukomys damarensis]